MPSFTVFKGSQNGTIQQSTTTRPDLTGDQVYVKVTASGVCAGDLHYTHVDMCLGHEGVGVVEAVGPAVQDMKKGDRVGWGYQHDSCGRCEQCTTGWETFCPSRTMYANANLDQGSFAHGAVWREAFLFKIPQGLSDEAAAPLQCAGATVFTALTLYDSKPTEVVGVMGIGGLGHLAIQFAAKLGHEVVVFSTTEEKKDEALMLGATEFISTKGVDKLEASRPIDRLLVTSSAQPDWNVIVPILAPRAIIIPLSLSKDDFVMPYMPILFHGFRIQGSLVASRSVHAQMLKFAALHKIAPIVERFAMTPAGIKECMDRLDRGQLRYRGVLIPEDAV